MKHIFRKLVTIASALILALPVLLFASCSVEPRSEADVIPEELGTAEGLWLYCGNKRSLSDGTGEETLLTSVTIEDMTYSEEEFDVITYKYVRDTHEIFFVLSIDGQYRAYHYNYLTKESSDLGALPRAEKTYDYTIAASSSLVYILNTRTHYGVIFSPEAQLLYEDFYDGTLDGDIVYRISSYEFIYFLNGEFHVIPLDTSFRSSEYFRCGKYVYFIGKEACGVNLETEEDFPLIANNENDGNLHIADFYIKDGVLYAMTINYVFRRDDETEHLTSLFKISGETAQLIYDFGNAPHGMRMGIEGDIIYFTKYGSRSWQAKCFVYDVNTGKMKSVNSKNSGKGKTPEDIRKQEAANQREANLRAELTVGEYTFYVTSIPYDDQPGMFGTHYTKTCYYLMRDHGGKSEVMQYNLDQNYGHFYDDIGDF